MKKYPKKIKRLIHEYAAKAYERELHRELAKLDRSFAEWRDGAISSDELSYRIHQSDTGPLRTLLKRYNTRDEDMSVAYAIVMGILDPEEVPSELVDAIEGPMNFFRRMKERDEQGEPG